MNIELTRDGQVLVDAYRAWTGCGRLRADRQRNKRFTFGDQWTDPCVDREGNVMTEGERAIRSGAIPLTNNLLRQLIRSVVGRFCAEVIDHPGRQPEGALAEVYAKNLLDQLDSRTLEEFLISGCAIQRVEAGDDGLPSVSNVGVARWMVDVMEDPRGNDCQLIGQLHDLALPDLLRRVAGGSRRKAQWVKRVYTSQPDTRAERWRTAIGADSQSSTDFWHCEGNRLRAIEVWTRESEEVLVCHNRRTASLVRVPLSDTAAVRRMRADEDVQTAWDVSSHWRCRWFAPTGDLLASWRADRHPFAVKLYPLVDGEVHSFVEGAIDQQKHLNRLVTLVDHVMDNSAKGVLLFPETALPDGFSWSDVRKAWSNAGGIIPYDPRESNARPEQIVVNATDIGAYEMLRLQMQLLEQVSGVSGALQGKSDQTGKSAQLYEAQAENANIALTDIYDSFAGFRAQRDALINSFLNPS